MKNYGQKNLQKRTFGFFKLRNFEFEFCHEASGLLLNLRYMNIKIDTDE